MNFDNLQNTDPLCYDLIQEEIDRQETSLELIPSECITSLSVIEALGSPLTNKYSEGYPGKRYYGGNEVIDKIENLAIERAKIAFPGVAAVNVQAYSGSPANMAILNALCEKDDTILGLSLSQGGHLTHGHKVSATSKFFHAIQYGLNKEGYIDLEEVETLAIEHKPKVIIVGFTAYSREFPFEAFSKIAKKVGAYLVADISHISGLVISGVHTSPAPYCDVIMTTTHKTLKGPRGALIMTTKTGLEKDPLLSQKIDKSIFPGLQGGPHNHQTMAIAVALGESVSEQFKIMNQQIVKNAKKLGTVLIEHGFEIATGGTDNHLLLVSVGKGRGAFIQEALDIAGITLNKNTIPNEPCTAFTPSGIRMGTPIMTMRGMKEEQMVLVGNLIKKVADVISEFEYIQDKEERAKQMQEFRIFIKSNLKLQNIRQEVKEICIKFPIYSEKKTS
ncbi:MAG: serine hydroxymethyltransferase [Candidatus Gracilibacteria bacterium]|nr:serine hydroxymethyltransferase [Candidatus Gracilibacteria bacterium]